MENGSFQSLSLSHLDFERETNSLPSIETADVGSSSFHTLLTQNEDLVARLHVTLKRLSMLEDDNKALVQSYESIKNQCAAVTDQLLVWKEKEKIWKEREQGLEKSFKDRSREMEMDISVLRQKADQLEVAQENLERYKKYHEKIKTSVRPYIQKLRSYTRSLFEQTRELNSAVMQKETIISKLEFQLESRKDEICQLTENYEKQKNQLIAIFEDERERLKYELRSVQATNDSLSEKTRHLERSLERQDELENLTVALRRSKDELLQAHQQEMVHLKESLKTASQKAQTQQLTAEDLGNELQATKESLKTAEVVLIETQEQLTGLRYMWTQKSQENEKMKMSLSSLEKINLELSQKLSELRNS